MSLIYSHSLLFVQIKTSGDYHKEAMRRCAKEVNQVFRFTHLLSFSSLSANKKRVKGIYKETMRRCLKEVSQVFWFSHLHSFTSLSAKRNEW